jgi:hypothetical protein
MDSEGGFSSSGDHPLEIEIAAAGDSRMMKV